MASLLTVELFWLKAIIHTIGILYLNPTIFAIDFFVLSYSFKSLMIPDSYPSDNSCKVEMTYYKLWCYYPRILPVNLITYSLSRTFS